MTGTLAIRARGLVKRFEEVTALDGISFEVARGELFGFLGPNGAGKTTTIKILTGLARVDDGEVEVAGLDCTRDTKAAQHLTGVVPDGSNLYPELSGRENLRFCGALYGMEREERRERADELLVTFGLSGAADRRFAGYSRGMRRKLTIAAGLMHGPSILFLDEPTTGIDVASARQIRRMIAGLRGGGTTIFLTTHYIEEAERLCDRIAFIVEGRIVRTDSVEALLQPERERHVTAFTLAGGDDGASAALAASFPDLRIGLSHEGDISVESDHPVDIAPLVRRLEEMGREVAEARRVRPSLEDVFVRVTSLDAGLMRGDGNGKKRGGRG